MTAAAIHENTVSCLAKLGILENQIYSLIADNESNVSKVEELTRSDFALSENFPDHNEKDKCDVIEASDSQLWKTQ